MNHRIVFFLTACLIATAAAAQTQAPAQDKSDSLAKPASVSSPVTYRSDASPVAKPSSSPFKFKSKDSYRPGDQPPPSANDKAAVMGASRPWQNGQAPINCAESPHDAGCQH